MGNLSQRSYGVPNLDIKSAMPEAPGICLLDTAGKVPVTEGVNGLSKNRWFGFRQDPQAPDEELNHEVSRTRRPLDLHKAWIDVAMEIRGKSTK